jgi:hypothetical protein
MSANLQNEYAEQLGTIFEDCPKAVFAAIAVSALTVGGDHLEDAPQRVADEWLALYQAGIVPQKPSGHAAKIAKEPL